jgi:hypothetical protein
MPVSASRKTMACLSRASIGIGSTTTSSAAADNAACAATPAIRHTALDNGHTAEDPARMDHEVMAAGRQRQARLGIDHHLAGGDSRLWTGLDHPGAFNRGTAVAADVEQVVVPMTVLRIPSVVCRSSALIRLVLLASTCSTRLRRIRLWLSLRISCSTSRSARR